MDVSRKEVLEKIVVQGFHLLEQEKAYSQAQIRHKMAALGQEVSASSLSNILNGKGAGAKALRKAGQAMLHIAQSELGYAFDEKGLCFDMASRPADWQAEVIPVSENSKEAPFVFYPEGRLSIQQKVEFLKAAQREVVEFGLRLHAFTDYFLSRNEQEFRAHIEELLAKGVALKLYLLDPESNAARLYFDDRARILPDEARSIEEIQRVIERLKHINSEFKAAGYPGKFEVFRYKHFPYGHFLIVDGGSRHGKLMASPYLYGVRRANCPVISVSKSASPGLYKQYWQSFQHLAKGAVSIPL